MYLKIIGRLAGVVALTAALAGCIDMTAEIDVQSETTGKATTTMTMGAEFYPMLKQMAEAGEKSGDPSATAGTDFCEEEGATLVENADGSATCTMVKEGKLDELSSEDGPNEDASFTVVSPGVVRVAFKTEDMQSQLSQGEEQDEQTKQMMKAYFEGHSATIRIKGKKIVETNMTKVGDNAAEIVIPFDKLIEGTLDLPPELFAVVDTN